MQALSGISTAGLADGQKGELEQFFVLSRDLLMIAGKDGYFKRVNPAFIEAFGYTDDELLARPFIDFIHPDDRAVTMTRTAQLFLTGSPTPASMPKLEIRVVCKDGSMRWIEWASTPVADDGLLYSIGRDITDQKQLLDRLYESEERYRGIVETTSEGIFIIDPGGKAV